MAGIKSTYLRNKVIDHVCGTTSFTMPAGSYLALYTTDPTIADVGTEVSGGSYARKSVSYGAASGGTKSNSNQLDFLTPNPVTVTHWGIRDALTAGNLLYFGAFDVPLVLTGAVSVLVGDLVISED